MAKGVEEPAEPSELLVWRCHSKARVLVRNCTGDRGVHFVA